MAIRRTEQPLVALLVGGLALGAAASPGSSKPKTILPAAKVVKPAAGRIVPLASPSRAAVTEALPATPPPGDALMSVSEVQPGMKGYGLTVFRGARIERFDVEVVGVLPKANVGQPLVLVKLSGGPISQRSAYLIQGMSGSPIYVNGKLLGAFSMGDAWAKDALGMVTPIESMLEALDPKLPELQSGSSVAAVPAGVEMVTAGRGRFRPLALPVTVSGLSGSRLDRAAELLKPFNLNVVAGPGGMEKPFRAELTPGAAIGVSLMTGDVEMSAIGTVTYRKGDRLLAFGHPMMQLGATQFPITTAWIHEVFSGYEVSHKIGSTGEIQGTLVQDRPYSVAARVGPAAAMIPVTYRVSDETTGRSRNFHVFAANHPLLVGQLIPLAVNQGLFSIRPVPADTTARVELTVETDGAGRIERKNVYFDPASIDLISVRELQEVLGILTANPYRRVGIKSVDMSVTFEEKRHTATVERLFLSQDRFEPGEKGELGVVVRPYRGEAKLLKLPFTVPAEAASGRAVLVVHGGGTRVDLGSMGGGGVGGGLGAPQLALDGTLEQAVSRFVTRERNNQLVLRMVFPSAGFSVQGEKLTQLPNHLADLVRSTRSTPLRSERDEFKEVQDSEWVLNGVQTLTITVQKPDHQERPPTPAGGGGGLILAPPGLPGSGVRPPVTLSADDELSVPIRIDGELRHLIFSPEPGEKEAALKAAGQKAAAGAVSAGGPSAPGARAASTPGAGVLPPATPADPPLVGRAASVWNQTTASDFERGTFENTVVTTNGEVRLAPRLRRLAETAEPMVWAVAAAPVAGGVVYLGTGHTGQVLKVGADGKSEVVLRTGEIAVHSLAVDAAGAVYAGTAPSGKVVRLTPDGKSQTVLSLGRSESGGSRQVLAVAVTPSGRLYAGVGPTGEIYTLPPGGTTMTLLGSVPGQSISALHAVGEDTLYAGTAEDGTLYRFRRSDEVAARETVYDTSQAAITGIASDSRGNVYAACAPSGEIWKIEPDGRPRLHFNKSKGAIYGLVGDPTGTLYAACANAVLRVEPSGVGSFLTEPRRAMFTSIGWASDGRILAGSCNTGSVYGVDFAEKGWFESTIHDARVPAKWGRVRYTGTLPPGGALKVETRSGDSPEPDAGWSAWAAVDNRPTGNFVQSPTARFLQYRVFLEAAQGSPSLRDVSVYYLPRNQAPKLTLAAPLGGELLRGAASLRWSAIDPEKDTLTYQVSYSADGGRTWIPIGKPTPAAAAPTSPSVTPPLPLASPGTPPAPTRSSNVEDALKRFREQLEKDSTLTAVQREEKVRQARDMIQRFVQESPGASSAANADGVTRLASAEWDTRKVADGIYLLRVVVSDAASNPNDSQLDVAVSEPVIVSNTPPQLFVFERGVVYEADRRLVVTGNATGKVSLKGAQFRFGEGDWSAIDSEDGIWDSAMETFRFVATAPKSGEQMLEIRVIDLAGNGVTTRLKVKAP